MKKNATISKSNFNQRKRKIIAATPDTTATATLQIISHNSHNIISTTVEQQVEKNIISDSDFSKKISTSKKNLIKKIERSESIDNSTAVRSDEQDTKISTRSSLNDCYKSDALCVLAESFCKPMNSLTEISQRPAEELLKVALNEHMNMIEALDTIREGIDCNLQHQMILFLTARFTLVTEQQTQLQDFDIVRFIEREKDYIQCVVENEVTAYYNKTENCNSIYQTTKLIGCSFRKKMKKITTK
jgi:hypothetical protein